MRWSAILDTRPEKSRPRLSHRVAREACEMTESVPSQRSLSDLLRTSTVMVFQSLATIALFVASASATDYVGGWVPGTPKAQCVDICVNSKATPTCLTNAPECLAKRQRPGDFDYMVFEQIFVPQFCRDLLLGVDSTISHQNVNPYPAGVQCVEEVVKSELTIHGLWPNYNDGYAGCCNVTDTIINHPLNAVEFAAAQTPLLEKMSAKWVDPTQSNTYDTLCEIYNHEFQKHGLCYNAFEADYAKAAVNYFEAALAVAEKLDTATQQINTWAKQSKPQTTLEQIDALYGKKVQALCSKPDGTNKLSAIRTCWAKPEVANATGPFTQIDCAAATASSATVPCNTTEPISLKKYVSPKNNCT